MRSAWRIRQAELGDAVHCAAIYAPYVLHTASTFEVEPPPPEEMATRIQAANQTHAWLVVEEYGQPFGYAYAGAVKPRAAYRWSCEVSVYLEQGRSGAGAGRALYEALFTRLAERGYRTLVAGMTLPNDASVALHRALGFADAGVFRRIGYKLDRWHDVAWMERSLGPDQDPPTEPH